MTRVALALGTAGALVGISWEQLGSGWARFAVITVVCLCGWAVPTAHAALPPGGLPLVLVGVSAVEYACVPETDPIRVLVLLPIVAGIAEVAQRRPLPFALMWGVATFVMWAGVHGATGRASALVGATVAWWPVTIAALLHAARLLPSARQGRLALLAPAGLAAAIVSRTGAIQPTVGPAWRSVVVWLPGSLAVTLVVAAASRRVNERGDRPGARRPSSRT